jgi:hypothetical protein
MGFSTVAMKFVSVAEGALIIYTMPIWAMLFAWPFLHVRPTARDVIALILGLAGVALLLGANGYSLSSGEVIGDVLSLACAMLFALGNVLNRKPLPMPPLVAVAWQVGLGSGDAHPRPRVRAPELRRDFADRLGLLRLHDAGVDGRLLSHLVRNPAPPSLRPPSSYASPPGCGKSRPSRSRSAASPWRCSGHEERACNVTSVPRSTGVTWSAGAFLNSRSLFSR